MVKIRKELLFIYEENARAKIKDVAVLFKKSSQRIKYTFKIMEKEGIIYSPYCIFDYSYFGLILFRVYFKGAYISEKDKSEIIKKMIDNEYVVSVYELGGEFDLVIEIEAPNPSRFNKVLKDISDLIPTLTHYKVILNLVTHIYPKYYLIKDESLQSYAHPQIIIGGDRMIEQFTRNELMVIKNLLNNPKIRMTTLAKQSDMNIKTAKSVMQALCQKDVIRGFKYIIDLNKMDIYRFRLLFKLHNLSKKREEELINYFLLTKEVVQANKTVGDWDLELDLESLNKMRIRELTIKMREIFKDIIETFNIMEFYQYHNKSYLPKYFFNQIRDKKQK